MWHQLNDVQMTRYNRGMFVIKTLHIKVESIYDTTLYEAFYLL